MTKFFFPLLFALALVGYATGCATGGSRKMAADKLTQLKPGVTTKQEMFTWFGSPVFQALDTSGKLTMNWMHTETQSYGFYAQTKSQMLSVIFDANGVLEKFSLVDDLNPK